MLGFECDDIKLMSTVQFAWCVHTTHKFYKH